jgi:hypothetical protein
MDKKRQEGARKHPAMATKWQRKLGKPKPASKGASRKRSVPIVFATPLPEGDLWVYGTDAKPKGHGAPFFEAKKEIRQGVLTARLVVGDVALLAPRDHPLLSELLPLQKKRKPRRTGKRAGPEYKVPPEQIRAMKRLRWTDAQIVERLGIRGIKISRWTIARHTK